MATDKTLTLTEEGNEMKDSKKILKMMSKMNDRMDEMSGRMDEMSGRMDEMNNRMDEMNERLGRVEAKTTDIQLTIENDIRRSINIIAEGHLDLNRKLDESMKVNHEKELMLVRVNHMETQIREILNKIEDPA